MSSVTGTREFQFDPPRDLGSLVAGAVLGGIGVTGTLIKKLAVSNDTSSDAKFWWGALALLTGGPGGLLAYCIATPGWTAKKDVQQARGTAAERRYG